MNVSARASFTKTIQIASPTRRVWTVMTDVERWPEWTASVTSVKSLDAGSFKVGSRFRIKQPKLPAAIWTVTQLDEDRSFSWVSRAPGLRTIGYHAVKPTAAGSEATLLVLFEGIFSGITARLFRGLNERYLEMEATGLKRRCEQGGNN